MESYFVFLIFHLKNSKDLSEFLSSSSVHFSGFLYIYKFNIINIWYMLNIKYLESKRINLICIAIILFAFKTLGKLFINQVFILSCSV